MTRKQQINAIGVLLLIEAVILIGLTSFTWYVDIKNGYALFISIALLMPILIYSSSRIKREELSFGYLKVALAYWVVLMCANFIRVSIFHYLLDGRYLDSRLPVLIVVSVSYLVPAFISALFSIKIKKATRIK